MKNPVKYLILVFGLLLSSCNDKTSLEEYYVENQSKKDFIVLDIPSGVFLGDNLSLTEAEQEKLKSIEKLNILAFPKKEETQKVFQTEKETIEQVLKNEDYKLLMRFSAPGNKVRIMYVGDSRAIDEIILYGSTEHWGFAVIRILGDDMDPKAIIGYVQDFVKNEDTSEEKNPDSPQLGELMKVFDLEGLQRTDSL